MRYVLAIFLIFNLACEEKSAERSSVEAPDGSPNLTGPLVLDDLYLDYIPYTTACAGDDHNCVAEDYVHEVDSFEMCEAIATWTHASGKMFILPDPGRYAGTPDMMVFYDDPSAPYGGIDEWGITGRYGTGHSDSTWVPPGIVYASSEHLDFGDCIIDLIRFTDGSGSVPDRAAYMGVEFLNSQTLLYMP